MYILGLNAFHGDSSACIYKNGHLIAASEEERFLRIKHWAGFPAEAIKFCLEEAGITVKDLDFITISRDPKANMGLKLWHVITHVSSLKAAVGRLGNAKKIGSVKQQLAAALHVSESEIKAEVINVEHHLSHLASAFYASPFKEAALLSVDGFGDFSSIMTGIGKNNKIEVLNKVTYPHSLGVFYTTFTQYLGFPHYGDEYKVMGLAPYGKPLYKDKVRDVIRFQKNGLFKLNEKYFRHPKEGVSMNWEGGQPHIGSLFSKKMEDEFGKARAKDEPLEQYHKDLAASVQAVCEDTIFHMLNHLHKQTGMDNVCIAGGVAQNSVANGKILANTPFKRVYIPPAGHDAGTSIGSALYHYCHTLNNKPEEIQQHSYFGSKASSAEIEALLKAKNINYIKLEDEALFEKVSACLLNGGVVGWFQGRAEFGPRALGHRSIIADPRRDDAKEILNSKIKRRESFRPFAPSILKEHTAHYFEVVDDVPFMEKVFLIKPEMRSKIPAVAHVDGTGRLQTVDKNVEPKYYGLIEAFYKKSGVPILLNTSFNENEPIVNKPIEALDCFLRTKMDMLVMEDIVVER